ncbi:TIM44-like domain-containing protein [Conexibacter woesei]|uniref:TIM44-like domain-containing protein n=1 Tax=Conexibacter woesei TaxID=191495 RepID=UPI000411A0A0|nr:TIM44-like domain-containing protein [Conexibacter woesei]
MSAPLISSILAAAGGGSSGFGGGGGGGGGGFGGGGGGGYVGGGGGGSIVFFFLIVVVVLVFLAFSAMRAAKYRAQRAARVRKAELAAAEAATDDEDFDPENVRREAAALFVSIQEMWSRNDIEGLEEVVGEDLMVEWRRRLNDFRRKGWRNQCTPHGHPQIEYMGLVNREGEDEDRVVVRITASLEDFVIDHNGRTITKRGDNDTMTRLTEWWTLHPPGARWRLLSIESDAEGRHHLASELVAVPWGDARVADAALVEGAVADAVPAGVAVAEIAPAVLDDDARAAALDLALADGRFAPDVLEIAARRAVEAWAEAIDGPDDALEALAEPGAIGTLLYGSDGAGPDGSTRVVVRGARVAALAISSLDPHAEPATMTATVTLHGRRYVEDRDTVAVLSGSKDRDATIAQRWTFALTGDAESPWRLVAVA